MGAMASKKASPSSPVSFAMADASPGAVSGPVAMMVRPQSSGGSPVTSSRLTSMSGWVERTCVIWPAKACLSTASAPPAGRRALSAAAITSEPSRRISQCSRPTAFTS